MPCTAGSGSSPAEADRRTVTGVLISSMKTPSIQEESDLRLTRAWWNAANYLTVAQIYLQENPLLREPLRPEHIKPRLLGHWGTSPGLNLVYAHLNNLIRSTGQDVLYVAGPATAARRWSPTSTSRAPTRDLSGRLA